MLPYIEEVRKGGRGAKGRAAKACEGVEDSRVSYARRWQRHCTQHLTTTIVGIETASDRI